MLFQLKIRQEDVGIATAMHWDALQKSYHFLVEQNNYRYINKNLFNIGLYKDHIYSFILGGFVPLKNFVVNPVPRNSIIIFKYQKI